MPTSQRPAGKQLLHFIVDDDLRQRLDDYRFAQRFNTRSDAIRWLLEWALEQNPARLKARTDA